MIRRLLSRKSPYLILLALGLAFACRWEHSGRPADDPAAADPVAASRAETPSSSQGLPATAAHEAQAGPNQRDQGMPQMPQDTNERIAQATKTVLRLSQCLRQDLCGQGPIGGYFDKHNTPLNGVLNQSLRFLKTERETSGITEGFPSRHELLENFKIQNTETQILSLELLLDSGAPAQQIFEVAPAVKDDAKPLYFETMDAATEASPALHEEFVNTLASSLHNDDINTVADTVASLSALTLSEDDFRQAVSNLCYIKSDPDLQHNWNEIDSNLIAYHETHAFTHSDPDQICRG